MAPLHTADDFSVELGGDSPKIPSGTSLQWATNTNEHDGTTSGTFENASDPLATL